MDNPSPEQLMGLNTHWYKWTILHLSRAYTYVKCQKWTVLHIARTKVVVFKWSVKTLFSNLRLRAQTPSHKKWTPWRLINNQIVTERKTLEAVSRYVHENKLEFALHMSRERDSRDNNLQWCWSKRILIESMKILNQSTLLLLQNYCLWLLLSSELVEKPCCASGLEMGLLALGTFPCVLRSAIDFSTSLRSLPWISLVSVKSFFYLHPCPPQPKWTPLYVFDCSHVPPPPVRVISTCVECNLVEVPHENYWLYLNANAMLLLE